jgi:glycosyltransferase involved in cell wall biosynthesis
MKKRILAISNHGAFIGGGEYSFLELLCNLPKTWEILSVVPETAALTSKLRERGVDTRTIPLTPMRSLDIPKVFSCIMAHAWLCAKYRPALVYANGSRAAFYGGIAGRLHRLPVVWHCRIADKDPFLDAVLCILSSCIIANSNATAARFKPSIHRKIRIVYNGLDLKWLRDPLVEKAEFIRNDWKVLLVVARVSRDKRHDIILSSFEKLAKEDPTVHLVCIGSNDALDPIWWDLMQQRTQQSALKERIHWIGHVKDVRPWYKVAHMLLLGSESESFGRVVVEAMACGVPVIATRVGAIPEILREKIDGILITPGSTTEVCEAALKLLRDESLRKRLSDSGRRRAEEFSLERHVKQMVRVFEETLGDSDRRFRG